MINQAVILCGGYGKRLLPLTKKIPKGMVEVDGKPFLEHLIDQCKSNGIKKVLLLCGYKYDVIKNFFTNKKIGIQIEYHYSSPEILTYSRIYAARHLIDSKFLLLYSDNYSSLNLHDTFDYFKKLKSKFLITICKKKPGNIILNKKKKLITNYYSKKNENAEYVEIGYMLINKKIIIQSYGNKNLSLSNIIKKKSNEKSVHFYWNDTGYKSISDVNRLKETKKFFSKKFILIDRDGVLNKKNINHRYVRTVSELKVNYQFLKRFKKFLFKKNILCITNQAGVATNDITLKSLKSINNTIINQYRKQGIVIKDFFISIAHYNSDHPDRKPNHGLFLQAAKKYKFILDRSLYIGDDIRDIEAAYRAKTYCIYIGKKKLDKNLKEKYIHVLKNKIF